MKLNIRVVDYTTMTLKQLEKEYTKETQILLDMISCNKYSQSHINFQKSLVDSIYKMICKKYQKINQIKGGKQNEN